MVARWVRTALLPLALVTGLAACDNNAIQPGIVSVSATNPYAGATGRIVSIQEARIRGGSQAGVSNGTLIGGAGGLLGGAILGGAIGNSAGGALLGGLLGAVGGAIAGTAIDRSGGTGRGIEVTVQKDDGQSVVIAQRDDGDVQLGDRVMIVTDRNGVAKAVRDNSRAPDQTVSQTNYPPANGYQNGGAYQGNYPANGNYPAAGSYQGNGPSNGAYQGNYPPNGNYQGNGAVNGNYPSDYPNGSYRGGNAQTGYPSYQNY